MPENRVEEMVRAAVAALLERQLPSFRQRLVEEVLDQIRPALEPRGTPSNARVQTLQKAVSAIQGGATQKEILRALLDHLVLYSSRAALFVIKNGGATGWRGTAFADNTEIKDFPLDITAGIAAEVIEGQEAKSGSLTEFDGHFTAKFGPPADGRLVLLPIVLKDKVSALVYADAGPEGETLDAAALDVLVRATSAWLEVTAQRKHSPKEGTEPEMHSAPAASDPFAVHAPLHTAHARHAEAASARAMSAAAGWGVSTEVPGGEEDEVHHKAQRFARLLMDEIKLYNQAKVAEGRKHKDLYDRLKEDIEKSRLTYQKRYGNTAAASADYFNQELIRSLAEDDVSLLGSNFQS